MSVITTTTLFTVFCFVAHGLKRWKNAHGRSLRRTRSSRFFPLADRVPVVPAGSKSDRWEGSTHSTKRWPINSSSDSQLQSTAVR